MESNEVKRMSEKRGETEMTLRKTIVPPLSGSRGTGLIVWFPSFISHSASFNILVQ